MNTLKDYINYLTSTSFSSWPDALTKMFILLLILLVLLWISYAIINKFNLKNRVEYKMLRDVLLDINLIWAFCTVFLVFGTFWGYVLYTNGIDSLKYEEPVFWKGLSHILIIYLVSIILFLLHFVNIKKNIKS